MPGGQLINLLNQVNKQNCETYLLGQNRKNVQPPVACHGSYCKVCCVLRTSNSIKFMIFN